MEGTVEMGGRNGRDGLEVGTKIGERWMGVTIERVRWGGRNGREEYGVMGGKVERSTV